MREAEPSSEFVCETWVSTKKGIDWICPRVAVSARSPAVALLSLLGSCSCPGTKGRAAERCPRRPIPSWRGSGVDVAASVLAASHSYFFVPGTWSAHCYRVESVLYREMASYHFSCWFDAGCNPSVLKSYLIFSQCSVCLPVTEAIPDKLSPRCKRAYQKEKKSSQRVDACGWNWPDLCGVSRRMLHF